MVLDKSQDISRAWSFYQEHFDFCLSFTCSHTDHLEQFGIQRLGMLKNTPTWTWTAGDQTANQVIRPRMAQSPIAGPWTTFQGSPFKSWFTQKPQMWNSCLVIEEKSQEPRSHWDSSTGHNGLPQTLWQSIQELERYFSPGPRWWNNQGTDIIHRLILMAFVQTFCSPIICILRSLASPDWS